MIEEKKKKKKLEAKERMRYDRRLRDKAADEVSKGSSRF